MIVGPSGAGKELTARHLNGCRARGGAVCRHQRRRDHARSHGGRAVRHRAERTAPATKGRRAGGGARRHAVHRRIADCRAKPRTRSCACWSTRRSSASAARPRSPSTCALCPPPAAISRRNRRRPLPRNLYHRLSVVPTACRRLPSGARTFPTRVLFMEQISQSTGLPQRKIGSDAMAVLQSHDWPGNVRQLRNNVERLMILAGGEPDAASTPACCRRTSARWCRRCPTAMAANNSWVCRCARRANCSNANTCWPDHRFGGNISRTAEFVGMERSALHRKLKALGIG